MTSSHPLLPALLLRPGCLLVWFSLAFLCRCLTRAGQERYTVGVVQGGVGRVCVNPVMTVWAAGRGGGGGGQGAGLAWAQRQLQLPEGRGCWVEDTCGP